MTSERRSEGPRRRERTVSASVTVYLVVLLALQIFLLTVALDGLLGYDPGMAWAAAGLSIVLAIGAGLFFRYLRGGQ
jgi:hypothetical protein